MKFWDPKHSALKATEIGGGGPGSGLAADDIQAHWLKVAEQTQGWPSVWVRRTRNPEYPREVSR